MNTLFTNTTKTVSARFLAAVTAFAMILSAFPAAFFVAEAATSLYGPQDATVTTEGGEFSSGAIDASGYTNLFLEFTYDSTELDATDDSFTYGWRDSNGDNDIETIIGVVGTDGPTETGNVVFPLPEATQVADLEVYVYVTAVPGNDSDEVRITELTVTGDEVVLEPLACELAPTYSTETESGIWFDWNLDVTGDTSGVALGKVYYDGDFDRNINPITASAPNSQFILNNDEQPTYEIRLDIVDEQDVVLATCSAPLQEREDPIDVCPNLEGDQELLPKGLIYDEGNDCVPDDVPEPCTPEENVFADVAEDSSQGLTKSGDSVSADRSNDEDATGNPDWVPGGSDGFFSLGFGGWIIVSFDKYVLDVDGDDISIHEATNGSYPLETAKVEVSQNGSDWYELSEEAGNDVDEGGDNVTLLDFSETGLNWIRYVRITDTTDPAPHADNADGFDLDAVDATSVVCDEPERTATIVAHKIVCTDEAELPNYGKGGPNMTETTAADWVASHSSCSLVPDWQFQWGPKNAPDTADDFVGEAASPWNTFGPTDIDGKATVEVPESAFDGNGDDLWFREVLQEGYLPFSHQYDTSNNDDESAEVYCHTDVLNYDNRDRIDNPEAGETYYCVAWNHRIQSEPDWVTITGQKFEDYNQDGDWTEGEPLLAGVEICLENLETNDVTCQDTNESGYYVFDTLFGGIDYEVTETVEEPWVQTAPVSGSCVFEDTEVGVEYYCDFGNYNPNTDFAPYCGDGELNQEWEQCDGGEGCTAYCTFENQCQDLGLVKISLDDTDSVSFDPGVIFLGDDETIIPSGVWFNFDELGDADVTDTAEAVDGLAVSRDPGTGTLKIANWGGNSRGYDKVVGSVMLLGLEVDDLVRDLPFVPKYRLEQTPDNGHNDATGQPDDMTVTFDWQTYGIGDGMTLLLEGAEEYDCPDCKAEVEARVVLQDGGEIVTNGDGNLLPQVILGDGSVVPFGEWFKLSEAPALNESAEWIDDADTVTNYPNPGDLEGLFVSREGNGMVKVALYGYHSPGGDTNFESLRATIEFNDAGVASAEQIPGNYKLENHSETDGVASNDNFDSYDVNPTSVDFDFWVDTKADGIKITLDENTIESCDDDSNPEEEMYLIDGYKHEQGDDYIAFLEGWEIELYDEGGLVAATSTDENGYYYFYVPAGEYEVYEVMQDGWEQVGVQDGDEYVYPEGEPHYCSFEVPVEEEDYPVFNSISLQIKDVVYNYSEYRCDFYNARVTEDEPFVIDGYKYQVSDNGTTTYAGWEIALYEGETLVATTTTDENGYYSFEVYEEGYYEVYEETPEDWVQVLVEQNGYPVYSDNDVEHCGFEVYDYEYDYLEARVALVQIEGYQCDFYNEYDGEVIIPEPEEEEGGGGGGGTRRTPRPTPLVLGEATSTVSQCPFLTDHMQMGWENDPLEVMKLQLFLNIFKDWFGGVEQPVTGTFGATTDLNVKAFQEQYRSEILDPWYSRGIVPHNRPTGFVYKTTLWKINDIVCPEYAILPDFEGENLNENVDLHLSGIAD